MNTDVQSYEDAEREWSNEQEASIQEPDIDEERNPLNAGPDEPLNRGRIRNLTDYAEYFLKQVGADASRYNLNDVVQAMEVAARAEALNCRRKEEERGEKERG